MLTNVYMLIYVAKSDSFMTPFDRRMAMMTEVFLAAVTFHLIVFTDFVPDKDTQYFMGFSFMFWIISLLVINISFVVIEIFRLFKLKMIQKWNVYEHEQTNIGKVLGSS